MNSVHEKGEKNEGHGIQLSLNPIMESAKEGLLALAVQRVASVSGDAARGGYPIGRAQRQAQSASKSSPARCGAGLRRHGGTQSRVDKPRVRSVEGEELHLQAYEAFQDPSFLTEAALERMIHGLSTRHYAHGLEPAGVDGKTGAISKSTISRRFVEGTKKKLA
jgi:putative transposase